MGQNDESVQHCLMEWAKLIHKEETQEDTWTVLPVFPNVAFKNFRIEGDEHTFDKADDVNIINITMEYDEFKPIEPDERI